MARNVHVIRLSGWHQDSGAIHRSRMVLGGVGRAFISVAI